MDKVTQDIVENSLTTYLLAEISRAVEEGHTSIWVEADKIDESDFGGAELALRYLGYTVSRSETGSVTIDWSGA